MSRASSQRRLRRTSATTRSASPIAATNSPRHIASAQPSTVTIACPTCLSCLIADEAMTAASPTTTAPSARSTPSTVRRFLRPASATVRSDGCRIASRRSSASAVAIPREELVRPRVPDAHPRAEHITRIAPRRQCEGLWPLPGEAFALTEDGQLPLGPGSRSPCFTRVHTAFAGTLTLTYGCFREPVR